MPETLPRPGQADCVRINLEDPKEVAYWTAALNVSSDELRATIQKFGSLAKEVRRALSKQAGSDAVSSLP